MIYAPRPFINFDILLYFVAQVMVGWNSLSFRHVRGVIRKMQTKEQPSCFAEFSTGGVKFNFTGTP